MKKSNKIILIIVLIIVFVLSIIGVVWFIQKEGGKKPSSHHTVLKDAKTIVSCYNQSYCARPMEDVYQKIESDINDKKLQKWIEEVNQQTEEDYQKAQNSNTTDSTCIDVKDMYKHSLRYSHDYTITTQDGYLSLSVKRFFENLCTHEQTDMQANVFLYDLKRGEPLTQEQLMKKLKITEEEVVKAIKDNIDLMNQNDGGNLTIENTYQNGQPSYVLYYGSDGSLLASYLQKEHHIYYAAIIRKNANN